MSFRRVIEYATAASDGGKSWTSFMHKSSSPVLGAAGNWADGSVGAGIPRYNAYVGTQGEFTVLEGSGNFGLYTGPAESAGEIKTVSEIALQCSTATMAPSLYMLCDYLGHYALVDCDSTDTQTFTTSGLTRYTDGHGVRIMPVCTVPQTATATCTLSYTNAEGVSGRTASFFLNAANIGTINCAAAAAAGAGQRTPFVPLAGGDTGVVSIEEATFSASAGGFVSLVLVKPICQAVMRQSPVLAEKATYRQDGRLPVILPGACLNFIFTSGQSAVSSVVRGYATFVWG